MVAPVSRDQGGKGGVAQGASRALGAGVYGLTEDETAPAGLSVAERKALADAIKVEDLNRVNRGELVEQIPTLGRLAGAMLNLRRELMQVPAE